MIHPFDQMYLVANTDQDRLEFGRGARLKKPPTYIHDTLESAEAEAERLALKYPVCEFAVLRVAGLVRIKTIDSKPVPVWERE